MQKVHVVTYDLSSVAKDKDPQEEVARSLKEFNESLPAGWVAKVMTPFSGG